MRDQKPPLSPIEPGALPVVKAPESVWSGIVARLDAPPRRAPFRIRWWQFAAACAVVAIVAVLTYVARPARASWQVVRLDGSPEVGSKPVADTGRIAVGQWLQTDASSRARIAVGDIGTVDVEPNSRVRLVAASPNEHRLSLAHGEISATVSAPPRLFIVDTPASTAFDLGCAYTMKTDESGSGLLRVTAGWVSLEREGRESLVPAGASCRTHAGSGAGTPFFDDASEPLQQALAAFDFERGGAKALDVIRSEARVRDTLTLWNLLSRVDPAERVRLFDRMVELTPLPQGLSREKILDLDKDSLKRWIGELAWKW